MVWSSFNHSADWLRTVLNSCSCLWDDLSRTCDDIYKTIPTKMMDIRLIAEKMMWLNAAPEDGQRGHGEDKMRHWTPLWSMIVDSSLWSEPDYVCKVFVTMLALKDSDDVCRYNAYQLAQRSHKKEDEVLDALKILASPDKRRIETQEHEGRRIKAVVDGWLILNGAKYREMVQVEMRRARWRRGKEEQRRKAKEAFKGSHKAAGYAAYEKMIENGASQEALDAHVERVNRESIAARKDRKKPYKGLEDPENEGPM